MIGKILILLLIFLAAFAGFAFWKSQRNDRQAEIDYPPIGEFITIDGVRVHFTRQGSGPTIVLIHGAGGNVRDFTFSLAGKLAKSHQVIAFDRPGHGYTESLHSRGESPAEQAVLLSAALKRLGVEKAIVGGYSYGGAVALAWALDDPDTVQGVLLMNAVSNPWVDPPSYLYGLAAGTVTGPIFSTLVSAFAPENLVEDTMASIFAPKPPPQGYLDYIGAPLAMRRGQLRANGRQVDRLLPFIREQSARYGELTMPVEIVHGIEDKTVPMATHADQFIKQVPHAGYQRVEGVGHSVHHYAQDEILTAIERLER